MPNVFQISAFFHQRLCTVVVVLCRLFHRDEIHSCAKSDATLSIKYTFLMKADSFFLKGIVELLTLLHFYKVNV